MQQRDQYLLCFHFFFLFFIKILFFPSNRESWSTLILSLRTLFDLTLSGSRKSFRSSFFREEKKYLFFYRRKKNITWRKKYLIFLPIMSMSNRTKTLREFITLLLCVIVRLYDFIMLASCWHHARMCGGGGVTHDLASQNPRWIHHPLFMCRT